MPESQIKNSMLIVCARDDAAAKSLPLLVPQARLGHATHSQPPSITNRNRTETTTYCVAGGYAGQAPPHVSCQPGVPGYKTLPSAHTSAQSRADRHDSTLPSGRHTNGAPLLLWQRYMLAVDRPQLSIAACKECFAMHCTDNRHVRGYSTHAAVNAGKSAQCRL